LSHESLTLVNKDKCGNETTNLFSYVQIGQASGTLSGSSTPSTISVNGGGVILLSPTPPASIATITVNQGTTVIITSFIPSDPTITISTPISSSDVASTSSNPLTSGTQSDDSQTSEHLVDQSSSFWDSSGKVAGVFLAVGIIIILLVLALFWMCGRRRRGQDEEKSEVVGQPMAPQTSGSQTVSRSTSLLQLLGRRDQNRQEEAGSLPPATSHRLSRSPTDVMIPVIDQRLDPLSMMIRFDENDSQTSFRDEDDYSRRVWRVTNASESVSLRSSGTEGSD
jgi:cell wall integrity and stress response component